MTEPVRYRSIAEHYERCLAEHGDSHLGVDWPNAHDAELRHQIMLGVIRPGDAPVRLLDVGCGASHLYDHMLSTGVEGITYAGLDISEPFVELSRAKHPGNDYWRLDLLTDDLSELPRFDYAVMNGVFTEKLELGFDEMLDFFERMVERVFSLVDAGIAFNVISNHVDWERDDLFHVPFDTVAAFLTARIGRNFLFRNDYGLYEYTTYVYR
jgi:SAM-dependent methyltransferase